MNISELSIKRPVTIIMCILIVVVLGVVSLVRVPVDLMPSMNFPIAIVVTNYEGAGPQEVEKFVTENIESAMSTVNNMKSIQSQTSEGSSIVIVEFNDGTDMEFAALQMREKIDMVKGFFPEDVSDPMVMKMDPNMLPIAQIGISSSEYNEVEIERIIENDIKPRLERLDGVASVDVSGAIEREIKVEVDPEKMSGYGLSFNQIANIMSMENINLPGGSVEYGSKNLIVKTKGEFDSVQSIRNIPLILPQGNVIYLRDVATITDGFKQQSSYTRMNMEKSIGISIQKETTANTVNVISTVKTELESLKNDIRGIDMGLVFDQGQYIERSISSVALNAIVGGILAVIILFLFLRNIRTTLIIGIAIPVSVISTFVLMFLSNTTLNLISMGGLALGIGMMVDNSIVVLENIFRHRQAGETRISSALKGAKEVGGAVIASTLTTVVVFVPIIFTEGIAAEIFKEMALTVTFSLLASLVVALTVVPMLSSRMLKVSKQQKKSISQMFFSLWERFLDAIDGVYRKALVKVLRFRKTTVFVSIIIFAVSITAVYLIGIEFIPATDEGQFIVDIKLAEGSLLGETDEVVSKVEKVILDIPEVEKAFTTVGGEGGIAIAGSTDSNTASISTTLVSKTQRERSTAEIVEEVRDKIGSMPGAEIKVSEMSMMSGGGGTGGFGGAPVSIEISGYDLEVLKSIAEEVEETVRNVEGTRQVESSVSKGRPEAQIYVEREKASMYGLNTMQIASTVRTSLQGQITTRYRVEGDETDVRLILPEESRKTLQELKNVKIMSPTGVNLLLDELVDIKIEEGPVSIARKNQTRYVTVTSELFDRDVGGANTEIGEKLKNIRLPEGYSFHLGGQNEEIINSFSSLGLALLLSILLIYMVMAAQFESLLQPFIVMFAVPLAFSGAAIGLALTGRTFNVASFIGVIMLSGIVVNNAIILIDYVNQLRSGGMERNEAIIKAGPTRLRPILMTTLTTVLAMIPLAIGIGEGAEMQAPLATVVIFGLSFSTLLTLLFVPVIYTIFDDVHMRFKRKKDIKAENIPAV